MNASSILEGYADREALAAGFNVTPRTINRWMNQPDGLPYVQLGGRILFNLESVRTWLAARERHPNQRRGGRHGRAA